MPASSETMTPAGQVILPAILQVLFDRLASKEFLDFARQILGGVHSDLKALEKRLRIIEALVRDAEVKQLITNPIVKMWLEDLQELANDVEDILDEFACEALRRKLMTQHMTAIGKVQKLILTCFLSSWSNVKIIYNIQVMSSRLEELYKLRSDLGLQVISGGRSSFAVAQNRPQQRPRGLSVPTEPAFRGRKKAKSKILKMVSRDGPQFHIPQVN